MIDAHVIDECLADLPRLSHIAKIRRSTSFCIERLYAECAYGPVEMPEGGDVYFTSVN
jgi:hypothetical protein